MGMGEHAQQHLFAEVVLRRAQLLHAFEFLDAAQVLTVVRQVVPVPLPAAFFFGLSRKPCNSSGLGWMASFALNRRPNMELSIMVGGSSYGFLAAKTLRRALWYSVL